MKSKTKISQQIERKTNPDLVKTVIEAKKNDAWILVASILSGSRRNIPAVNLELINKECKEGDIIVVPGKVLGQGNVEKKIKVAALSFSEEARRKLNEKKCQVLTLMEEIKSNPKAEGVKLIK